MLVFRVLHVPLPLFLLAHACRKSFGIKTYLVRVIWFTLREDSLGFGKLGIRF